MPLPGRPAIERFAFFSAVAAWIAFALVGVWEISSPLPGGHYGAGAAFTIAGEQMARWKMFATVFPYTAGQPGYGDYYAHHPWGMTIISAALFKVVGHTWAATRLPAVLMSALTPPLLYRVGRALWGVVPAAVASVAFCVVPVDLAFAAFWNLEVASIFFGMVFTLGTLRFWQTWKSRWMALSVLGAAGAVHVDWVGCVLVAAFVLFSFARAYVLARRRYGRLHERQHARWFAFVTAAAVGSVLFYVVLFSKYGRMQDLLDSYNNRTRGDDVPLLHVLRGRRLLWLYWMLTPLGLWLAGLGAVVSLWRLRRDPLAIVLPAWIAASAFEYFGFKQAADTHIFWPHQFGACVALGAGVLTATFLRARERLALRFAPATRARFFAASAVGIGAAAVAALALLARVGVPILWQARITGGRFDEAGRRTDSERDRAVVAEWAGKQIPRDETLLAHASFGGALNVCYGAERAIAVLEKVTDPTPKDVKEGAFLLDARYTAASDLRYVAARWAVTAVGPIWRVDRNGHGGALVAVRFEERLPRGLEALGLASDFVHAVRDEPDPWATWEWRAHLGQRADAPAGEPTTLDELRVAHNAAVAGGDTARAAALYARLAALFPPGASYDYTGDVHLVGVRVDDGALPVVTLMWRAGPSFVPFDGEYLVHSRVFRRPLVWPTLLDGAEKETAPRAALGPPLWRRGFVYTQRFIVQRRLGAEKFFGFFQALADGAQMPSLESGAPRALLFTLE